MNSLMKKGAGVLALLAAVLLVFAGWSFRPVQAELTETKTVTAAFTPASAANGQEVTLTVDIQGNAQEALEGVLPAGGSRDFFRITLTGCGTVDLSQLEKALGAWPNLELVDHTEPPLDVWGSAGEDTLEGIYFQMLRQAKELNPEQAQRIQLAAEISRRLLEGREVTL